MAEKGNPFGLEVPKTIIDGRRYRIELHQEQIGIFAHNFWVLRDITNKDEQPVIARLDGYAFDANNEQRSIGSHEDTLRFSGNGNKNMMRPTPFTSSAPICPPKK